MSGAVNASFSYDGLGRRTAKTVNGVTTAYVYDGLNFVQEKSAATPGAAVTANLLTGLDLDETFLRMSGSGAAFNIAAFLPDANNNTIYTTNRYYSMVENHRYEPYGAVTHLGMDDNTQLYTGRENDGTGLYYYRARYYHPVFGRFISEDPLDFAAGPNLYAYVHGNPVSLRDPRGTFVPFVFLVSAGAAGMAYLYFRNTMDGYVNEREREVSDMLTTYATDPSVARAQEFQNFAEYHGEGMARSVWPLAITAVPTRGIGPAIGAGLYWGGAFCAYWTKP